MESRRSKCGSMVEQEDRLSGLPDHLLHSILHGLSLKDVVRTSGISRKWAAMWLRALATSRVLDFTDRDFVRRAPAQVAALVSLCLRRHADRGAPLDVLRVALEREAKALERDVVVWVADAVARGAREVEVDMTPKRGASCAAQHDTVVNEGFFFVELPRDLLQARNSLVRLALDRFSLRAVDLPGAPAGIAGLRSLSLSHANVTDEEVEATLSACRSLEFLSLRCCHLLKSVRIVGAKLRGLELVTCTAVLQLRVTAPALESFVFHGDVIYLNGDAVDLGDTPALRDAYLSHIGFGNIPPAEHEYGFYPFLNCVARAESLTLCSVGLKHMWVPLVDDHDPPPVDVDTTNVQELQLLMVCLDDDNLEAMSTFFQLYAFLNLDRLFFQLPGEQVEASDVAEALDGEIDELDDCIFIDKFVLDSLRLIKVVNYQGRSRELALLAFLLQGAPALEQLVLVTVEQEQGALGDTLLKLIQQRVSEMTKACVTMCGPSEDRGHNPAHTRLYHME